jgi:hypothetical protein
MLTLTWTKNLTDTSLESIVSPIAHLLADFGAGQCRVITLFHMSFLSLEKLPDDSTSAIRSETIFGEAKACIGNLELTGAVDGRLLFALFGGDVTPPNALPDAQKKAEVSVGLVRRADFGEGKEPSSLNWIRLSMVRHALRMTVSGSSGCK